jgi:hypothetical protein
LPDIEAIDITFATLIPNLHRIKTVTDCNPLLLSEAVILPSVATVG